MTVDRFQLCWRCLNAKTWSSLQCHRTKAYEIKALNMQTQPKFWLLESVKIARTRPEIKSVSKRRTLAGITPRLSCFGKQLVDMSNHRTYSRVFATGLPLAKLGALWKTRLRRFKLMWTSKDRRATLWNGSCLSAKKKCFVNKWPTLSVIKSKARDQRYSKEGNHSLSSTKWFKIMVMRT